ncbi:MAG: DUF721 domain-containing protein [Candidatus Cloacimonetes bacterium]|nr:DUF721 domain-containing protein [Candidatus Cloacimonadota bacterium]
MALSSLQSRISQLLYRVAGEEHHRFIQLFMAWERVVGKLLAERSHPIRLDHETLFVGVENSAWLQELTLLKSKIISAYQDISKVEIKDIVFIIKSKGKKKK